MTRDPGGILGNGLNEKNGSPVKECPEGDSVTDSPMGGLGGRRSCGQRRACAWPLKAGGYFRLLEFELARSQTINFCGNLRAIGKTLVRSNYPPSVIHAIVLDFYGCPGPGLAPYTYLLTFRDCDNEVVFLASGI